MARPQGHIGLPFADAGCWASENASAHLKPETLRHGIPLIAPSLLAMAAYLHLPTVTRAIVCLPAPRSAQAFRINPKRRA